MYFQDVLMTLERFFAQQGCLMVQPYDIEVGAGTFNPHTLLRALGPEPWNVAYVEPSRRPADGRYGENPNRLQQYYQYQVIMKPSPKNIQELYLDSLGPWASTPWSMTSASSRTTGNRPPWGPGAWAGKSGWTAWRSPSSPISSSAAASISTRISVELTFGLERIAMYLQGVESVYDLKWSKDINYGDVHHRGEVEHSTYNFELADVGMLFTLFDMYEKESLRIIDKGLVLPAYDYCLKCSHAFNLLNARGAISVAERASIIGRVRNLARLCSETYLKQRETMGFPLLKK